MAPETKGPIRSMDEHSLGVRTTAIQSSGDELIVLGSH